MAQKNRYHYSGLRAVNLLVDADRELKRIELVLSDRVAYLDDELWQPAGRIVLPASASAGAFLNLPHGAAPASPVNGDIWTTTAGLYVRINGATVGPLT